MDLVLFGIQGSGKGTQAKRLSADFGYYIFEAGRELREIKESGSELGKEVASYIDAGELVPFVIIMKVVKEAILALAPDQKILFDGIPRDLDQMHAFDQIMQEVGREFRCLHIRLDLEEGVRRILGRAQKEGRADDQDESVIRRRMNLYRDKTMPVIQEYEKQGRVTEVSGEGTEDDVNGRIIALLPA